MRIRRLFHRLRCGAPALIAIVAASIAPGAAGAEPRGEISLGLLGAFPQGEFRDNLDNAGFGIGFGGLYRLPQSPVLIGANVAVLSYGDETRSEPFSTTIPDVTVEVTTTHSIAQGHLMLRLSPPAGSIRPYIDGLIGFNYLWTETKIEDEDDDEEIASSKNQDDATFSYGAGGGLLFRVYQRPAERSSSVRAVFIDLQTRYIAGGEAEYLKKGSIRRVGPDLVYDLRKSRTDLLTVTLGATVELGR